MRRVFAIGLLGLGLLQMAADVLGLGLLRGAAAATGASPAPRVFSSVRGLETYSSRFVLRFEDAGGRRHAITLTPELYERIRGPYNRRNAYGAVLAYGPVLAADEATRPLFEAVARFALCGDAPLLIELGIDSSRVASPIAIELVPRPGTEPEVDLAITVSCT
jgi:hypothetical protein